MTMADEQHARDDAHVVVSLHSIQAYDGGGSQFYHTAVFDGETFHAACGADQQMKIPVLVRRADLPQSSHGGEDARWFRDGYWPCSRCDPSPPPVEDLTPPSEADDD